MENQIDSINWSRNFDTDEIDDEDVVDLPNITFKPSDDGIRLGFSSIVSDSTPFKAKTLFFGFRFASSIFLLSSFPNKIFVGEFVIDGFKSSIVELRQPSINHKAVKLYFDKHVIGDSEENILICVAPRGMPEASINFSRILFSVVDTQETFILDTIPQSTYLGSVKYNVPCLRVLSTESSLKEVTEKMNLCEPKLSFLESPVLIQKHSAGVLQYCQIQKKKAAMIVSLEGDTFLEVSTIQAFESALPVFSLQPLKHQKEYSKFLKQVVSNRVNPLYA